MPKVVDINSRINKEAGNRLRQMRTMMGLSLIDLAELIQIHRQTISLYERGLRPISGYSLIKLADFYKTTTDHILGRTC